MQFATDRRFEANRLAFDRLTKSDPVLVDVRTAGEFIPGFTRPGTGSPEPGGLLPREALQMIHTIAAEGLCGMEVVEVSPPYDVNDNTAQLAARVILDVLGTLVAHGHLGHRNKVMK